MGIIAKFNHAPGGRMPRSSQSASWSIVRGPGGKHLRLEGHSSSAAKNPGNASQNMTFPPECIEEFEEALKKWKEQN